MREKLTTLLLKATPAIHMTFECFPSADAQDLQSFAIMQMQGPGRNTASTVQTGAATEAHGPNLSLAFQKLQSSLRTKFRSLAVMSTVNGTDTGWGKQCPVTAPCTSRSWAAGFYARAKAVYWVHCPHILCFFICPILSLDAGDCAFSCG